MVLTRSQYENMSKEELIQKLININSNFVSDINAKLTDLSDMTKFILSCNNVRATTLIYFPE